MVSTADPRAALVAELSRSDGQVDLARAALLIALEEYRDLRVDEYLHRLDELADGVRERLSGDEGPTGIVSAINGYLFRDLGFAGNRADYYDPRNSYLNQVLDRRTGIPITLSIVYQAIAQRLGHHLVGLNLPMHFVLAWQLPDEMLIVDVFDNGAIVSAQDCAARLAAVYGKTVHLGPSSFIPVGPRPIVRRVLNNLRAIYVQREDYERALAAVERMQLVLPMAEDMRDRGLLLFRIGRHRDAEADLSRYLAEAPSAPDRSAIEAHLDWVRRLRASAN